MNTYKNLLNEARTVFQKENENINKQLRKFILEESKSHYCAIIHKDKINDNIIKELEQEGFVFSTEVLKNDFYYKIDWIDSDNKYGQLHEEVLKNFNKNKKERLKEKILSECNGGKNKYYYTEKLSLENTYLKQKDLLLSGYTIYKDYAEKSDITEKEKKELTEAGFSFSKDDKGPYISW